jgi:hypothetical protein
MVCFFIWKCYCDFLCLGESFPRSALKKLENLRSLRIWELLQEKVTYNTGRVLPCSTTGKLAHSFQTERVSLDSV